jgi:hypothetical protein
MSAEPPFFLRDDARRVIYDLINVLDTATGHHLFW